MTTPRPRAVVIGSLTLFAALFALLTFQLSANAPSASAGDRNATAKARQTLAETKTDAGEEPEEPVSGYAETEEPAYAEPEEGSAEFVEPEVEYVEPEVEEIPPVVTSSS